MANLPVDLDEVSSEDEILLTDSVPLLENVSDNSDVPETFAEQDEDKLEPTVEVRRPSLKGKALKKRASETFTDNSCSEIHDGVCCFKRDKVDMSTQVTPALLSVELPPRPVAVVKPCRKGERDVTIGNQSINRTIEWTPLPDVDGQETFPEYLLRRNREMDAMARLTPPRPFSPLLSTDIGSVGNVQRGRGERGRRRGFRRGRGQSRGRGLNRGRGADRGHGGPPWRSQRSTETSSPIRGGGAMSHDEQEGGASGSITPAIPNPGASAVDTPPVITLDSSPPSPVGSTSSTDSLELPTPPPSGRGRGLLLLQSHRASISDAWPPAFTVAEVLPPTGQTRPFDLRPFVVNSRRTRASEADVNQTTGSQSTGSHNTESPEGGNS